ncbi:hypothetical protein TYRP_010573 [Tyrophagus putrescentiae]|nr:hypothetical protein TYRP_010573 [Tyrophagus putrescentiae]
MTKHAQSSSGSTEMRKVEAEDNEADCAHFATAANTRTSTSSSRIGSSGGIIGVECSPLTSDYRSEMVVLYGEYEE